MRLVYAHFPISAVISKDKKQIEIRNFLGGKKPHTINLNPGCDMVKRADLSVIGDAGEILAALVAGFVQCFWIPVL